MGARRNLVGGGRDEARLRVGSRVSHDHWKGMRTRLWMHQSLEERMPVWTYSVRQACTSAIGARRDKREHS